MSEKLFDPTDDFRLTLVLSVIEDISKSIYNDEGDSADIEKVNSFSLPTMTILSGGTVIVGNPIASKFYHQKQRMLAKVEIEKAIEALPEEKRGYAESFVSVVHKSMTDIDKLREAYPQKPTEPQAESAGEAVGDAERAEEDDANNDPVILFLENVVILSGNQRSEVKLFKVYIDRIDGWTWGGI